MKNPGCLVHSHEYRNNFGQTGVITKSCLRIVSSTLCSQVCCTVATWDIHHDTAAAKSGKGCSSEVSISTAKSVSTQYHMTVVHAQTNCLYLLMIYADDFSSTLFLTYAVTHYLSYKYNAMAKSRRVGTMRRRRRSRKSHGGYAHTIQRIGPENLTGYRRKLSGLKSSISNSMKSAMNSLKSAFSRSSKAIDAAKGSAVRGGRRRSRRSRRSRRRSRR